MYPLGRTVLCAARGLASSPLPVDGVSEIQFRCRPWDLDMFLEMNNGRVLTLYDLGRFDLAIRTGLARALKTNRWGLAVAGSSIRYRRRITLLQKVTIKTQALGFEGRWIFLQQSMWVNGEPASALLIRTCVTSKGKPVAPEEVTASVRAPDWNPELPAWVISWMDHDDHRPWPP